MNSKEAEMLIGPVTPRVRARGKHVHWRLHPLTAAIWLALNAGHGHAAAPLPAGTLPVPQANWVASGQATRSLSGNALTVNQATPKAILNWQSFNIANGSSVRFVQPSASSAALNRIFDANPSVIQGQLSANGQIYLINQNGIVFDRGAQLSVGSLIGSTLNITDDLFNNGILTNAQPSQIAAFSGFPNGLPSGVVMVESGAVIEAPGGRVMLLAPAVSNNGVIRTPDGQTILAAGAKVYLAASTDPALRGLLVEVDNGGSAQNLALGQIVAERGNATLAGLAVNQSGRVSATTSVNVNGSIRLLARDTVVDRSLSGGVVVPEGSRYGSVTLGKNSKTEVLPDAADRQTIKDSQAFNASRIDIAGKNVELQRNAAVRAPGGTVNITAQSAFDFQAPGQNAAPGVRVYLAEGSRIDVAGSRDVSVAAERNSIAVELRGNELRDAPLQRDGILRGKTVYVDARTGTPLADVSGYLEQIERGVGERTAAGGAVNIRSEGDIVLRTGSLIDVSGGSIDYLAGTVRTTQLLSQGRVIDIGHATPDRMYDGFADSFVVKHDKWGITQSFVSPFSTQFTAAYTQGANAGSVAFLSHGLVLNGELRAQTQAGPYQRDAGKMPLGGLLSIGDASQRAEPVPDFRNAAVALVERAMTLPAGFTANSDLPSSFLDETQLAAGTFNGGGFNRVAIYSNGTIRVPADVNIELAPATGTNASGQREGGTFSLHARSIDFRGDLRAPSAAVTFATHETFGPLQDHSAYGIAVGPNAHIDVKGRWVNDLTAANGGVAFAPLAIDAGSVSLDSVADARLGSGSVIDVSAGGRVGADRALTAGHAGSIAIKSGRLRLSSGDRQDSALALSGSLLGYGLTQGAAVSGGSLSLSASSAAIGVPSGALTQLSLAPEFFSTGGFTRLAINGQDGLIVAPGVTVAPSAKVRLADARYVGAASADGVGAFTSVASQPLEQRIGSSIALSANSKVFGDLTIGSRAVVRTEPTGSIKLAAGNQITVAGTLQAPAGSIALATLDATQDDTFAPGQSIWLTADARLLAGGYMRPVFDARGQQRGDVLPGGSVTIAARRGYAVAEAGSLIDVSGIAALLDLPQSGGVAPVFRSTLVAGDAGSIVISAQEGFLVDGTLRAQPGGTHARGGTLALMLDPRVNNNVSYPTGESTLIVSDASRFVPAGLRPGQVVDPNALDPQRSTLSHRGLVSDRTLAQGGFDQIALKSPDFVQFSGEVSVAARRSVSIDALAVNGAAHSHIRIDAPYVSLASTTGFAPKSTSAGDAQLQVNARLIDLEGDLMLQGLRSTVLSSQGDIRMKGVFIEGGPATLKGSLVSAGDITLAARQIYPTTLAEFAVAVRDNPAGSIIVKPGSGGTPVQSAGGKLILSAPKIEQGGVLKAPFGAIALNAAERLDLKDGSITSVSGESQQVLFGRTDLSGNDYIYALSTSTRELLQQLPEKRISLEGASVHVGEGARLDVSGGGSLLAYEFTPGPGGSKDVLDPANAANAFAVLPGYRGEFAPYDHQEYLAGVQPALRPGDQVYLSGAAGLAAGTYTLLPARYALLPNAWLVTQVAGKTDLLPSQASRLSDGGQIVAGNRRAFGSSGETIGDVRSSGFLVRPGSYARTQAEYLQTSAAAFFAGISSIPADAGALSMQVTQSLQLDGSVISRAGPSGRGARVDISAPRIAVVDTRGPDDGSVQIETDVLNRMAVDSLLLGGVRSRTQDGWLIAPGAAEVIVRNSANNPLTASELILSATQKVSVASGASIEVSGARRTGDDLSFAAGTDGKIALGALLRVSSADAGRVQRQGDAGSTTDGVVQIGANASIKGRSLDFDANGNTVIAPDAHLSGMQVSMAASRIGIGEVPPAAPGLALSPGLLSQLQSASELTLRSYSAIDFFADLSLGALDADGNRLLSRLTLDTATISSSGGSALLNAGAITFLNTSAVVAQSAAAGAGRLQINAATIELGQGDKAFSGFAQVAANVSGDIHMSGTGKLATQASTTLTAQRITAAPRADQSVDTGTGALTIASMGSTPANGDSSAAHLSLSGRRVDSGGVIDVRGGHVSLRATGGGATDSVTLQAGARILTAGSVRQIGSAQAYTGGGNVSLSAEHGDVKIASDALIDLTGGQHAPAGALSIKAAHGHVTLAGAVHGASAAGATSGRARIDALELTNFSEVVQALAAGGFQEAVSLRARSGDVRVAATDSLRARNITIAADAGMIDVRGTLDASGTHGGSVMLAASRGMTVGAQARLNASSSAMDVRGGTVDLATSNGTLNVASGAAIDVSGGTGAAGGSVLLHAPRVGADEIAIDAFGATVTGAAQVVAAGVKVYEGVQALDSVPGAGVLGFAAVASDNAAFMADASSVRARLHWSSPLFHMQPEVQVRSSGDLTVKADWNLFSSARAGGEPGILTLRAANNLNLNGSLSDGFGSVLPSATLQSGSSWSYRLIAGADMSAADVRAVKPLDASSSGGDVTLATGKLVRTGTGSIEVAAARDIKLNASSSVIYTAGVPGPSVPGFIPPRAQEFENGRTVFNIAPVYPTGGGDITLDAQRDVIGVAGVQLINDWLYRRTSGLLSSTGYTYVNPQTTWWPRFNTFQQGIGTLGGGDVSVVAGRDVENLSVVVPTNGRLGGAASAAPSAGSIVIQGGGDLTVASGRDIAGGIFYIGRGVGNISAQGSIVARPSAPDQGQPPVHVVLALGDGQFTLSAGGDAALETVFNPTLVRQFAPQIGARPLLQQSSFNTYGERSAVQVTSAAGSIDLFNNRDSALSLTAPQIFGTDATSNLDGLTLYAASLRLFALGGDINVQSSLNLYPAEVGDLQLVASRSVMFNGTLNMLDTAPSRFAQIVSPVPNFSESVFVSPGRADSAIIAHAQPSLHLNDPAHAVIVAGTGDVTVTNLSSVSLPKPARIEAGEDLRDLNLDVQNLRDDDVTRLVAGRDLVFASPRRESGAQETNTNAIRIGGPGRLEILAGRDVDLGTSRGLISRGNLDNPFLAESGAAIAVAAGLGAGSIGNVRLPEAQNLIINVELQKYRDTLPAGLSEGDQALRLDAKRAELTAKLQSLTLDQQLALARQTLFTELRDTGRAFATAGNYDRGYRAIDWLFPSTDAQQQPISYQGDVKLFFSQIKTEQGGAIDILAPGGIVNAGLANPGTLTKDAAQLGIVTVDGGSVRAFSRGDFLVNQSRVFTLAGGDILLWSSAGNIDAGKGAKTTSVAPPPQLKIDANGNFSLDITQSIQGSGIGVLLAKKDVAAGDVDLIAPRGEVNAGDAGIRVAGNLNIAALRVVGADNIRVGGVSSGVPVAPTTTLAAATAGVANTAADATKAAEQATQQMAAGADLGKGSFIPSFISVELLGLGEEEAK